ncbi:MAG: S8 family peptidase [Acidobacteriota bacterium]
MTRSSDSSETPAASVRRFDPSHLDKTILAPPLLDALTAWRAARKETKETSPEVEEPLNVDAPHAAGDGALGIFADAPRPRRSRSARRPTDRRSDDVWPLIVDLNLKFSGGRDAAERRVIELLYDIVAPTPMTDAKNPAYATLKKSLDAEGCLQLEKTELTQQYLFVCLTPEELEELVRRDCQPPNDKGSDQTVDEKDRRQPSRPAGVPSLLGAIYKIWPDFPVRPTVLRSAATVKCDAARISFSASGRGIVWAVVDSGIEGTHLHFVRHSNVRSGDGSADLTHRDFTASGDDSAAGALRDDYGHGTHVAGIIAGEYDASWEADAVEAAGPVHYVQSLRAEGGQTTEQAHVVDRIAGMAPECRLVSLKVLDANGNGSTSNVIAALAWVQQVNRYGRDLKIHGVNLSLGYEFEPEWFACGQSPMCVEVDQLVKSGVVVVAAAGNTGFGRVSTRLAGIRSASLGATINDPGNAERAITVGSTHRDMPHVYGVSYFSSKGPTGDGRSKPDLIAPGEKIVSCAAGRRRQALERDGDRRVLYREDSGTSMASPHVSGAIAAFLSIRREFVGQPDRVKQIFLESATSLGRDRYYEGHGLLDLMRAIQSV